MTPGNFLARVVLPGLALLPAEMNTPEAQVMLVAPAGQESHWTDRRQLGDGPAHGYYQCEGGPQSGLVDVLERPSTTAYLHNACAELDILPTAEAIYAAIVYCDALATVVARLILWADPAPLPPLGATWQAWATYVRCWKPGRPDPARWPDNYWAAQTVVPGPWPLVA